MVNLNMHKLQVLGGQRSKVPYPLDTPTYSENIPPTLKG